MIQGTVQSESDSLLHRLNPLSKLVAIGPLALFLTMTTNVWTPAIFILLISCTTIIFGRISLNIYLKRCAPMLLFVLGFMIFYPLMVSKSVNEGSKLLMSFGFIHVYEAGIIFGSATGLRLLSLLVLSMLFTLTTDTSNFIRALIQQWKVNYRFGYGTLAVLRFIPILMKQFKLVKMAHQVRGYTGKSGFSRFIDRIQRYALPLLSSSIRHAERTAYSMESRAFGAFPTRTYYRQISMVRKDFIFICAFWFLSVIVVFILHYYDILGDFSFFKTYH